VVAADRQVKRVAGPEGKFVPFNEASRVAEMVTIDRDNLHARPENAVKKANSQRPTLGLHLTGSHLDRKGGGDFGDTPFTDQPRIRLMIVKPQLNGWGRGLTGDRRDDERGVEIVSQ
jgi:hypothetical protein